MADQDRQVTKTAATRRQALKAGVAAGVGLAAWTGPTITSIGGTPAYAATCTNFTVNQTLADRNTDQSAGCSNAGGSHRYKPPGLSLPANYTMNFFGNDGECNSTAFLTNFTFPNTVTCRVNIRVYENGLFTSGPWAYNFTHGPAASPIQVKLPAASELVPSPPANARWSIIVQCVPNDQASCFT